MIKDTLKIANKKFTSRLIVGTGKYKNFEECAKAVKISGAEIVTVAVRRVNIVDKSKPLLMDYLDPKKNYLSAKHCRMFYVRRSTENFETCKRNWGLEVSKIRGTWR